MKINRIIEIIPKTLWSVWFDGQEHNEFDRIFEQWGDLVYLEDFFIENIADLQRDHYDYCTVAQAVKITNDDAIEFESKLLHAAEQYGHAGTLGDIFKPLDKSPKLKIAWEKSKAYGGEKNWLRVYAIRIATDVYVVTGGAIKLTEKMQDREHTQLELDKANLVREFLKGFGIESEEDLGYIEFD